MNQLGTPNTKLERNESSTLKDLDWLQTERRVHLSPSDHGELARQITEDCTFLAAHNIMDHSLLLGMHEYVVGCC